MTKTLVCNMTYGYVGLLLENGGLRNINYSSIATTTEDRIGPLKAQVEKHHDSLVASCEQYLANQMIAQRLSDRESSQIRSLFHVISFTACVD